jgi:endonuclease YncB( thermonuclease family)
MKVILLVFILVVILISSTPMVYGSGEFDKIVVVEWVWDGDTFRTDADDWIRLADIDAPEEDENITSYWEAKNYLISTIYNKTVYLDIDDKYTYDNEGQGTRLVCVVYVEYNQSHYIRRKKCLLSTSISCSFFHLLPL